MEMLDVAVWEEVQNLLQNPLRLCEEYERRSSELEHASLEHSSKSIEEQVNKLKRSMTKLIDMYMQEYIEPSEFEPRMKEMKQRLKLLENEKGKLIDQVKLKAELRLIVNGLEQFFSAINIKIENIEWHMKRDIIRLLVKRIEINKEEVNVVFRVQDLAAKNGPQGPDLKILQHCPMSLVALNIRDPSINWQETQAIKLAVGWVTCFCNPTVRGIAWRYGEYHVGLQKHATQPTTAYYT